MVKNLPAMQETQEVWVQSLDGKTPWRRAWQPSPVFLPGESHGQRSLVAYVWSMVSPSQTRLKQLSTKFQVYSPSGNTFFTLL